MLRQIKYIICLLLLSGCFASRTTQSTADVMLELPAIAKGESVIYHTGYTASFNSTLLIPNWVAYELTRDEVNGTISRPSNSPFKPDPDYDGPQPSRNDYTRSGWDRGHMAPAADMKWSEQAMLESFYFTNICPQQHNFNAKDWERLEEKARQLAQSKGSLYVICGPIITTNEHGTIGPNQVTVPDSFFKAFLYKDDKGYHSIAYIMPNRQTGQPSSNYALTVNDLEKQIGLDLFTNLKKSIQESVESQLVLTDWE